MPHHPEGKRHLPDLPFRRPGIFASWISAGFVNAVGMRLAQAKRERDAQEGILLRYVELIREATSEVESRAAALMLIIELSRDLELLGVGSENDGIAGESW
jgi:hypothetical protein